MIRRDYLRKNVISTLKDAYKTKKEQGYSLKDCSLKDVFNVTTRESLNAPMSRNGGNYEYSCTLTQVSPCIFKITEDWSCDIDTIDHYLNYNGFLVMDKEELEKFFSLPTC